MRFVVYQRLNGTLRMRATFDSRADAREYAERLRGATYIDDEGTEMNQPDLGPGDVVRIGPADPSRETDPHARPNVEVWNDTYWSCDDCGHTFITEPGRWPARVHADPRCPECTSANGGIVEGWFYAFGFPGCMHDSEPCGPFDSEAEALAEAREGLND